MGLGTKDRQKQTADICNNVSGNRVPGQAGLVEEFTAEFEGVRKDYDVTSRGQFTDIREEMLKLPQQASFNP
jgi:hypothetical protein